VRGYADDDRQAKRLTVTAPPPFYEPPLHAAVVCRRGKRALSPEPRARARAAHERAYAAAGLSRG